jgi:hypothetical protein
MYNCYQGEQTLIGIVLPKYQAKMKEIMSGWKAMMSEQCKIKEPEEMVMIEFSFKRHKKLEVYRDLARAVNNEWFRICMKDVARYFAFHTNLAHNVDIDKRIDTIYHFLKLYKKKFTSNKRLYGSIVVTAQQRHLSSTSNYGTGSGNDSYVRLAEGSNRLTQVCPQCRT